MSNESHGSIGHKHDDDRLELSEEDADLLGTGDPHQSPTDDNDETDFHMEQLSRFAEDMSSAARRIFEDRPGITSVVIFICWWESARNLEYMRNNAQRLARLFREVYGYIDVEEYAIPTEITTADFGLNIQLKLQKIKGDTESLFIFYYGGHGIVTDKGDRLLQRNFESGSENVEWEYVVKYLFKHTLCRKLFIFDCCQAGAMIEPTEAASWLVPAEMLCACPPSFRAYAGEAASFTAAIIIELERRTLGIADLWALLCSSAKRQEHHLASDPWYRNFSPEPRHRSVVLRRLIELETRDEILNVERAEQLRQSDVSILIKVAFRNSAATFYTQYDDIRRDWEHWLQGAPDGIKPLCLIAVREATLLSLFESNSCITIWSIPLLLYAGMVQNDRSYQFLGVIRSSDYMHEHDWRSRQVGIGGGRGLELEGAESTSRSGLHVEDVPSALHQMSSRQRSSTRPYRSSGSTATASSSRSIRLLSLDGGGVKGISSLRILEAIMKEVHEAEAKSSNQGSGRLCLDPNAERLPIDYFDLAAGTSVGGISGILLSRLRMNVSEAAQEFRKMAKQIFAPTIFGFNLHLLGLLGRWVANPVLKMKAVVRPAAFSATSLEEAIVDVVEKRARHLHELEVQGKAVKLLHSDSGKLIVCATLAEKGESIRFRTYATTQFETIENLQIGETDHASSAQLQGISILDAAMATSAAPSFLPPRIWNGLKLWDGSMLNNNPIHQLWRARSDLVPLRESDAQVACVVSIGTGLETPTPMPWSRPVARLIDTVTRTIKFATNTEAEHKDFKHFIDRLNLRQTAQGLTKTEYFRFNVPTGNQRFDLDDYQSIPKLERLTEKYIEENIEEIRRCAGILAEKGAFHCTH